MARVCVGTMLSVDVHGKSFVGVGVREGTSMESSACGEILVGVGVREETYKEVCGELLIAEI